MAFAHVAETAGFRLERAEPQSRTIRYAVPAYSVDRPAGRRYLASADNNGTGRGTMSTPEHLHKLIQIYLRQFQDYQKNRPSR